MDTLAPSTRPAAKGRRAAGNSDDSGSGLLNEREVPDRWIVMMVAWTCLSRLLVFLPQPAAPAEP